MSAELLTGQVLFSAKIFNILILPENKTNKKKRRECAESATVLGEIPPRGCAYCVPTVFALDRGAVRSLSSPFWRARLGLRRRRGRADTGAVRVEIVQQKGQQTTGGRTSNVHWVPPCVWRGCLHPRPYRYV